MSLEPDRSLPPPYTPHDLRGRLQEGFFVDAKHLKRMMEISTQLSMDTPYPAVFRTINGVLSRLLRDWEDRPLTVERALQIEGKLKEPMVELVDGTINGADGNDIMSLLERLSSEVFLLNDPVLNGQ